MGVLTEELIGADVSVSRFSGTSGVQEFHFSVCPRTHGSFREQLSAVLDAYRAALAELDLDESSAVLRRYFCGDLANQASELAEEALRSHGLSPCAVSIVGQAAAPPQKICLWAYHIRDDAGLTKMENGATLAVRRGALSHLWTTQLRGADDATCAEQTALIFDRYNQILSNHGATLADHAVRTWLFVRDIDTNYGGMVSARKAYFARHGLTPQTHYIASTGVGGLHERGETAVAMDAYAIAGLRPEQVTYLSALEHLSPTHLYGVTFERGTAISYRDRKHVLLSGTASIDREGTIVHPGDVRRQLDRTIENIEALLRPAGASLRDFCSLITYVRDPGDLIHAKEWMQEQFPTVPLIVVVAPVCRPGWLIEVEGMAVVHDNNPTLPAF